MSSIQDYGGGETHFTMLQLFRRCCADRLCSLQAGRSYTFAWNGLLQLISTHKHTLKIHLHIQCQSLTGKDCLHSVHFAWPLIGCYRAQSVSFNHVTGYGWKVFLSLLQPWLVSLSQMWKRAVACQGKGACCRNAMGKTVQCEGECKHCRKNPRFRHRWSMCVVTSAEHLGMEVWN